MRVITKPTKDAKHYMTYEGAKHLGACEEALLLWENTYGKDYQVEASDVYGIFKETCVACFATEVLRQLNDDAFELPIDMTMNKGDQQHYYEYGGGLSKNLFCVCVINPISKRKLTEKNQKRLEYLMRCIIETCNTYKEEVDQKTFRVLV